MLFMLVQNFGACITRSLSISHITPVLKFMYGLESKTKKKRVKVNNQCVINVRWTEAINVMKMEV